MPAVFTVLPARPVQALDTESLRELSGDLYTVQLMTMSNRRRLAAYMAENSLVELPVAELERDGESSYALLLGVYETAKREEYRFFSFGDAMLIL